MYNNYLIRFDFIRRFQETLFEQLINENPLLWQRQESYTLEMVANYLNSAYNMAEEFSPFIQWVAGNNYLKGQRVIYPDIETGKIYVLLKDLASSTIPPPQDSEFYGMDNRNLTIVTICVDLLLYELQSASTNQLTDITVKRREDAITFLNAAARNKYALDLPRYDSTDQTQFNIISVAIDKNETGGFPY